MLDHPGQNPTADQTDATTVGQLRQALAAGFTQAWALTRTDPDATAWIFPTAYHIKVAVRDRTTFWLSSGNWNNSNQPDIDPVTVPADALQARHRDRDWHVVIEQPQLAGVFEDYIRNDLQVASGHNTPPEAAGKPLMPPSLGSSETPAFSQFFPAATVTGTIKIAPLLTPDPGVYAGAISDAHRQRQPDALHAVPVHRAAQGGRRDRAAVRRPDQRGHRPAGPRGRRQDHHERVREGGLPRTAPHHGPRRGRNVKIQKNVHNKGIVVDGAAVLVSSQNWSADGTLHNRDAGVIIYHQEAAQYFQQIFLHDWEHLAAAKAVPD